MADVTTSSLAAALRDRYVLERELGRGGMATVFLAHDLKHDRPVALKVLHPEVAATLGPERFQREIRLAARLQHPHILSVYDSGEAAGQLWFTMPYVEGQSLRDRLHREQQLPVEDALRITREAAAALDYAHEHGVVHRDVKPENILLTRRGEALVADFGIARALGGAGAEALTQTGMAVGTPAYMSPEQAAGGAVDGRSDLYSLGCVLYEMLAGEVPYTGPTAQAILAKRFSDPVPSVRRVRPMVPEPADQAIQQALALVPADRFQTVAEFAQALLPIGATAVAPSQGDARPVSTLPTGTVPVPRARSIAQGGRRRVVLLGVAAVALVTAVVGVRVGNRLFGTSLVAQGVLKERERILVADFGSPSGDSILSGALTEAFRVDLAQLPAVTVVQPEYVQQVLGRMQRDPRTPLGAALAREVALRDGIKAYIAGEVARAGTEYVISVRLLATESGDALVALRESAHDSTRILAALDKLSRQLRERIGGTLHGVHATQPLEEVTTSSLEALRKYSLGVQATRRGEEQRAVALLEEATALDTGFAMAYRKVGIILGNVEMSRSRQVEALREAYAHRERLTDRERYLAVAGWAGNAAGDVEHAMEAYRSVLDLYPADATAANNLAMDYNGIGEPAKAEELARRAIGSDPTFPGSWMHLAHSKFLQGQTDSARRVVAASRPHLAPPFRDLLAADLATNAGEYDSATAHYEQMGQARSEDAGWRRVASTGLARVHAIRGRLRLAEREYDAATEAARAQHNDMQVLKVAIERAKLSLLRGDQADVIKTIDGLVPRDSLAALPPLDRQHLALAELYALAGKPDRSRALVTQYEHDVPAELRSTDEAEHHAALGAIALAERRPDDAAADFSRMRVYGCGACNLPLLARAYDAGDHPDSALATYERYVTMASLNRNEADLISRGPALFRLGELYEATGDRAKAADYYGQFVVLWKHADPELQPRVVEAKRRLAALSEERSR